MKRPKLTKDEKTVLHDMVAGWKPFPFQSPDLLGSLDRKGLVRADYDDKGRIIYVLTDEGRESA